MALIINPDEYVTPAIRELPPSLVHSHNSKLFNNLEEAKMQLTNKTLLPAEFAVAYYNDPNSPYGENAVVGIGSLTHGKGNILLYNEYNSKDKQIDNEIENIHSSIYAAIVKFNTEYNELKCTIAALDERVKALENKAALDEHINNY